MPHASAERANRILAGVHPAAARCLSRLGRELYYPRGVPAQAADAAGCSIDATIGQVTDGHRHALPLAAMAQAVNLDPDETFLYAPQGGRPDLRAAWRRRLAGTLGEAVPLSLPLVTGGLTHGLSLVADLFVDPGTPVLLPDPGWGNYDHIFGTRRGGRLVRYPVMRADRRGIDPDGLERALGQVEGPAVLVLNYPNNPVGYSPTHAEARALMARVTAAPGPLVVVCDNAYAGMVWEPGVLRRGLFADLARLDPARVLAVSIDGATKELFFFGGRVGFLTFGCEGRAAAILEEKAKACARATVSSVAAPSQALVMRALGHPDLQAQRGAILAELESRYRALREALRATHLRTWAFNSGIFALVETRPGDAEAARRRLVAEGVGVIALPSHDLLRVSYGSASAEVIPALVQALERHVG